MDFRILGSLEIDVDGADGGARDVVLGSRKKRALIASLILLPNQVVSVDRLIDMVWGPEPPRTAAHSIQIYVSELRRAFGLESGRIVTRSPGYLLRAAPEEIDASRFEAAVNRASTLQRVGDGAAATQTLAEALRLWRGDALSEFADAEFAQIEIQRLEELRRSAVDDWSRGLIELGEAGMAVPNLEASWAASPLRERTAELLMKALYLTGRQADALGVYQHLRRMLADELGLDPSAELSRLQEQILLHDLPVGRATTPDEEAVNPYKGLRPFEESDAATFFGRDESIRELTARLQAGARLLSVVGHSGSGKSSLVRAGLVPALKSDRERAWQTAIIQPGPQPNAELEHAVESLVGAQSREPTGSSTGAVTDARTGEATDARTAAQTATAIVVDQAEELWTLADERERERFLARLVELVTADVGPAAVMTLRADFFGQFLGHPTLGPLFQDSIVAILPLVPAELQAAIVRPAEGVGVGVEPALLAELSSEMARRHGSLPLLQYALTEAFELRDGDTLTLDTYRQFGGMSGAVAGRSEHVFGSLGEDLRPVAEQVLLRLVVPDPDGDDHQLARVRLTDLLDLGYEPVDVGRVVEAFVAQRLLTVDRETVNGETTVEIAHEALIREWPRLSDAVAAHRTDLAVLLHLSEAAATWKLRSRSEQYLARGDQTVEWTVFAGRTDLRLSTLQREYLTASDAARQSAVDQEVSRRERERLLERRARNRAVALVALLVAAVIATGTYFAAGRAPATPEFLLLHNVSPGPFEQEFIRGFDDVRRDTGAPGKLVELDWETGDPGFEVPPGRHQVGLIPGFLRVPCDVAAGFPAAISVGYSVRFCPELRLSSVMHASAEGAFLAGAAAARKSETGRVGFLGGPRCALIEEFEAGFRAGVEVVDPAVAVDAKYLSTCGFLAYGPEFEDDADRVATEMFEDGSDVIFAAAGSAGWGAAHAAYDVSERTGEQLWFIGVDQDLEAAMRSSPFPPEELRARASHILTSVLLSGRVAVSEAVLRELAGETVRYAYVGIAEGAVSLSPSDDLSAADWAVLDELASRVADGTQRVPAVMTDEQGRVHGRLADGVVLRPPEDWRIIDDLREVLVASPARDGDATVWIYRRAGRAGADGDSLAGDGNSARSILGWLAEHTRKVTEVRRVEVGGARGYRVDVTCATTTCAPVLQLAWIYYDLRYVPLDGTVDTLYLLDHPDGGVVSIIVRDEDGEDAAAFHADVDEILASLEFGER